MSSQPTQPARSRLCYPAHTLTAIILMMGCPVLASATDLGSIFTFGAFGTLGVVHSSEDRADFSSRFEANGAGYTHSWSAAVDSLVALQVTANFTPQLSAVVQVISEQNYDNTYRPHVEWANIKYQLTPDLSARIGRTVAPAFLFSDTRKVAYTYPWVRPPVDVYSILPVTYIDGMDVSYRLRLGDWTNLVQAKYGSADIDLPNHQGSVQAREAWAIAYTAEFGFLTAHAAYLQTKVTVASLNVLFDAFRQFGPQGIALADKYASDGTLYEFVSAGATYDPGHWFMTSEWGYSNAHSSPGRRTGWYATGGYRLGKYTTYLTYAQARADSLSDPGLTIASLPPYLAGSATGLNAALDSVLRTKPVQNTLSLGARWDLMKNLDFKLQFDHIRIGAGSNGVLTNIQPGFQLGSTVNVFSASLDFVW